MCLIVYLFFSKPLQFIKQNTVLLRSLVLLAYLWHCLPRHINTLGRDAEDLCFKGGENEAQRSYRDRWYIVGIAPLASQNQSLLKTEVFQLCTLKQLKLKFGGFFRFWLWVLKIFEWIMKCHNSEFLGISGVQVKDMHRISRMVAIAKSEKLFHWPPCMLRAALTSGWPRRKLR